MRSFEIDHTKLTPGIYKHSVSGFVTTWDIRIKHPNSGNYMSPASIHTIEHTLASYLRYRYGNYRIVGIFPMGCQTGFYVLTRFIDKKMIYDAISEYIYSLRTTFTVPGATEIQCGQYLLQDLSGAKKEMVEFYDNHLMYQNSVLNYKK